MAAIALVNTKDMERAAWLEWRRKGIGGSDAAAIAGLCPWKSPMQVYLEKVGEIADQEPGEAAYWGTILEDAVAREFAKRTGLKVQRCNRMLQHPEHSFMIANLDREIICPERGRGVLEVKTTSAWNADAWDEDKLPDHVIIQVQHYLAVTGYPYAYVAVLIGGQRYLHAEVARDDDVINYLIKIEGDFWRLVESRTPPNLDGSSVTSEVLQVLYPEAQKGKQIILPPEAERWLAEYEEAAAAVKRWENAKDRAANELKALLQDAEIGIIGDRQVTWKNVSSARLDTKALKEQAPDIYQKFAKPSTTRRFLVK